MLWSVWACCSELQPVGSQYTEIERNWETIQTQTEAGAREKRLTLTGGLLLKGNYTVEANSDVFWPCGQCYKPAPHITEKIHVPASNNH